jgi:DNA-binding NarL/FixJ family response regulator
VQVSLGKPRIVIADDHTLVAEGVARLLQPEFEIAGHFSDGRALLENAPRLKPDVVILDLAMPQLNGIDAGQRLKELLPHVKIIVLTVSEDVEIASAVLSRWASGFLLKKSASAELMKAIRDVLQGKSYVTKHLEQRLLDKFIQNPSPAKGKSLTARQREVLQLLAEGGTLKGIADELKLTPRTVAYHKYRIMQEFGLKTNSDLVLLALKERVISGPEKLSMS